MMRWLVLAACASPPVPVTNHAPQGSRLIGPQELITLGFSLDRELPNRRFCRGRTCVCVRSMAPGRFDKALAVAARYASARDCEAQTGKMCGLDYVVYDRTYAFFRDGELVGFLRREPELPWCDPPAEWSFSGGIPDCDEPPHDERSLCTPAKAVREVGNPKDLLLLP